MLGALCLMAHSADAQTCSVNAGVAASVCVSADSFVLSGNASGALATPPAWRFVSGPNVPVITDSASPSTSVKGFIAGTYVFRYAATCSDAVSAQDSVTITVDSLPVFTAGADTFICGRELNMRATLPPGATGIWSPVTNVAIAGNTSPNAAFSVTGFINRCVPSYDAVWTVTHGVCTAKDTVTISFGGERATMPVIADQTICGTSFRDAPSYAYGCRGTLDVQQLSGPSAAVISYPYGDPATLIYSGFNIDGMSVGNYVFTVMASTCSGVIFRDTFQLTVATTVPLSPVSYDSRTFCPDEFDSLYIIEHNSSLLPGETITWDLNPYKAPSTLPDPLADTVGDALRLRNVRHPDSATRQGYYIYRYSYVVSNGTCSRRYNMTALFISPVRTVNFVPVQNLDCGLSTANIALSLRDSVSDLDFDRIQVLEKPAGAPDPSYAPFNTGSIDVSGLQAGKYVFGFRYYKWRSSCGFKTATVEVNVSFPPGGANAGSDQVLLCGVDSSVLAGNVPMAGQTGTWELVSGPSTVALTNPNAASLLVKNLLPGTYRLRWAISRGISCPANTDEMQVVVTPVAPVAYAGPDTTVCYGYTTPISGTPFGTGSSGRWRQTGGPAVMIADSTAASTTLSGTVAGSVYTFTYMLANACGSDTDTVVITTNASAGPSDARISTQDTCIMSSSLDLKAAPVTSGSGRWSQLSGPAIATIVAPSGNTTSVTGLSGGEYRFIWSVGSPGCDTLYDTVSVAYQTGPLTADAGPDRYVCKDSIHLNADVPLTGSGAWTMIAGAQATIADSTAARSAVTGLLPGAYDFRWTVRLGVCPAQQDEVHVGVSGMPSKASAMNDTAICGLLMRRTDRITLLLQADTPSSGSGSWHVLNAPPGFSFTSGIADAVAPNTAIQMIPGAYQLEWKVSNGVCPVSTDTVNIELIPRADAGPATVDLCERVSYILEGTPAGKGSVSWSQLSGPSTATITNPTGEQTTVADLVPGLYQFRYAILHPDPACSSEDTITLNNGAFIPANAGRDSVFCRRPGSTMLYLQADTPLSGSGSWSRTAGSGAVSYSPDSSGNPAIATVTDPGLHQFRWRVTSGACQADDYKDIIVEQPRVPPIDFNPLTVCKDSFTVSVNSPYTDYNYAWTFQRARITDTAGLNLTGPITNNFRVRDTNNIYLTITNPVTGCSAKDSTEIIVSCAYLPLPLTLLSFKAYKKGAWVLLQWDVAAEKDIRNYVVERSGDGRNWKAIKVLTARNVKIRSQYDFTDQQPLRGLNMYRLKINEYDQSSSYSAVRTVNIDASGRQLLVYPNPAAAEIRVLWNSDNDAAYLLADGVGRVVLEGRLRANTDNRIDISSVATGFYLLKIISGNTEIGTHKVQIHR